MLLSKKYKFIFIKSKKVAGTSVEVLLSNQICDDDIVTPVSTLGFFNNIRRVEKDHEEDWRKKNKPARNYQGSFIEETYLWIRQFQNYSKRLLINEFNRLFFTNKYLPIIHLKRGNKFYDHMPLEEVKRKLGSEVFKNYKTVSILRNPVEQAISDYFDSNERIETGRQYKNFEEYMDLRMDYFFSKVRKKFEINKKPAIDHFIKFESLKKDLKSFGKDINLNINVNELDKIKIHGQYRPKKNNEKENLIINKNQRKRIFESAGWLSKFYELT